MMIRLILALLSIRSLLVIGCGTAGNRVLAIKTSNDLQYSGTNDKIFATIYSGGSWKQWRRLDNTVGNCNDFVNGNTDYFNDFVGYNSKWEGIGLYNCGSDGLLVESVGYWTGSSMARTELWKPAVFGPFPDKCLYHGGKREDPLTPPGNNGDLLIDGDTEGCDGVLFRTSYIGTAFTDPLPGRPNCGASEYGGFAPGGSWNPNQYHGYDYTGTDVDNRYVYISLSNTQMILLCLVVVLMVSITGWITYKNCNGKSKSTKVVTFGHSDVEMA